MLPTLSTRFTSVFSVSCSYSFPVLLFSSLVVTKEIESDFLYLFVGLIYIFVVLFHLSSLLFCAAERRGDNFMSQGPK